MITENMQPVLTKEYLSENETAEIWNETGFTPSEYYIYLIEILHHMYYSGDIISDNFIHNTTIKLESDVVQGCKFYNITSREKMEKYAESCRIDTDSYDEQTIISMIISSIINDYLSEKLHKKNFFSGVDYENKISDIA